MIEAFGDLGRKRMPYVLVTGDQPDSRRDREIVEDLNAALVSRTGISQRKLSDVCFQIVADLVVIKSRSEAVVFPAAEQTMRNPARRLRSW